MEKYNPKKINVIANGRYITGYADGTFITAERNEDSRVPNTGAHGDVVVTESADRTGTVTVTLNQTSPSIRELRQLAKNGTVFPVQIVDANTQTVRAGGTQATILRTPGLEYGDEVGSVEIPIFVADFDIN